MKFVFIFLIFIVTLSSCSRNSYNITIENKINDISHVRFNGISDDYISLQPNEKVQYLSKTEHDVSWFVCSNKFYHNEYYIEILDYWYGVNSSVSIYIENDTVKFNPDGIWIKN